MRRTVQLPACLLGAAAAILIASAPAAADDATPAARPASSGSEKQVTERLQRLETAATELEAKGKTSEAIAAWEAAAAFARLHIAVSSERVAGFQERIAGLCDKQENWAAEKRARAEVLAIRSKLYGEHDWRVTDARLALDDADRSARLTADERRELTNINETHSKVEALYRNGEFGAALPFARQTVATCRRILGEQHRVTATMINDMAALHDRLGDYATAEPLYREALSIYQKVLGGKSPEHGDEPQ
jgi:tetratricopeptide (TPR) repeat protein